MTCCYKACTKPLSDADNRVEIKTVLPKSRTIASSKFMILWQKNGEAEFHRTCWTEILKMARSYSKKKNMPNMTYEEKALVKQAAKTSEQFDSVSAVIAEARRVADMIKSSSHCVAFTGAGISTSAGIGDYRGKSGKWTEMDQEAVDMDSIFEASASNEPKTKKQKVEEEETEEEDGVPYGSLRPTYTHEALYKLMNDGHLKYIISQNGDGLHGLSGVPLDKMSELHGNVFVEKCEKCGTRYERDFYVMDDESSQYFEEMEDFGKTDVKKPVHAMKCSTCKLSHRTGRKCKKKGCCGHLMDSIINFGDNLEDEILDKAINHATKCDLMLCLGTTLTVTPASDLVEMARKPLKLVICNRQGTHMDSECTAKTEAGDKIGCRVYADCDIFFRHVMKHMLSPGDLKVWERGRATRMSNYDKKRPSEELLHSAS